MPKKLSDFGFFSNMRLQTPQDGVLPYDLVNPLFTDYTDKLRFIYIPAGGKAEYKENHVFDFPDGSAPIKTFAYLNNTVESELEQQLFSQSTLDPKVELTELECASTTVEQLCLTAQQSEEAWVNFKLFGTMGLTFALIIITVIFISKYIKEDKAS